MEMITSTKVNSDILFKYVDFIASYEYFLISSKNRVANFCSESKLWLMGKFLYSSFLFFTKDIVNEKIVITALNYNLYVEKRDSFKKLIALQKSSYEPIPLDTLSWGVRSILIDFSKVFDKLEVYSTRIELELEKEEQKLALFLKENAKVSTPIDFDAIPKPAQNWEAIGSIESDETIQELLAALTK